MAVLTRKMKRNALFMEIYEKHLEAHPGKNAKQLVKEVLRNWEELCAANQGKKRI